AANTAPSGSTSALSFQRASGTYSSIVTSRRAGHCRRSATCLTQGTSRSAARAASKSRVKNVPCNSLRSTASTWAALARARGAVTTTSRKAKIGSRTARRTAPARSATIASAASVIAAALSAFASSHMRASQDLDAKVGVRRAHRLGRHRHEAVPGHPRRRVDLEERPRAVGAEDEVEPAPARAADDVEGREGLRADRALHCVGEPARAVVARVVGEILVLVVVIALRRDDADQRQRAAADDRRGELLALDELLDEHEVVVLARCAEREGELVVVDRADARDADRRALARRLDDQRQAELGDDAHPVAALVDDAIARR